MAAVDGMLAVELTVGLSGGLLSGDKYVGPIPGCDLGGPFQVAKFRRSLCQ